MVNVEMILKEFHFVEYDDFMMTKIDFDFKVICDLGFPVELARN